MMTTSPVWSTSVPTTLPLLIVDGRVTSLPVWTARTRAERNKGLLGTDGIAGALWITRCNWIHCFGMRYALEAVYVSRTGQVVSMATHRPGRMGAPRVSAAAVIEMEEGQAEALGIWRGSLITTTETTTGSSLLPDALPGAEHSYAQTPPVPQAALRA